MAPYKATWLVAVAWLSTLGCSGGSGGSGNGSASHANRAWDPVSCQSSTSFGRFSTDELQDWADCELENCKPKLHACYGPQFRSGSYDGPCESFIECAVACDCDDTTCINACPFPDACETCLTTTPCDAADACDLMCDLFPQDPGKTCNDVKRCCPGLAENLQEECVDQAAYHEGTVEGEDLCAGIYPFYAVASSTCD